MSTPKFFRIDEVRAQIEEVFSSWGFSVEQSRSSSFVMSEADLNGIDSHGIAMLIYYEGLVKAKAINPSPQAFIEAETQAIAVINADNGLGHGPSIMAIDIACEKASKVGVGAVTVKQSDHFGSAGVYAARAAERGMISVITSNGFTKCVVPAGGTLPMFSTNPIAFGAPCKRNKSMMFDVAIPTTSIGKVNIAWLQGKKIPEGWVVGREGESVTDPEQARIIIYETGEGGLTPLGGKEEMSVHKGYGLCLMIEVLSSVLGGAQAAPLNNNRIVDSNGTNTGHFFLAINPASFRAIDEFHNELDDMLDALRQSPSSNPEKPVLIPGDIEWKTRYSRSQNGIPLEKDLLINIERICKQSNAKYLLG